MALHPLTASWDSLGLEHLTDEVNRILSDAGRLPVDGHEVVRSPGRNTNWIIHTDSQISIFIKQIDQSHVDREQRIRRIEGFEQLRLSSEYLAERTPRLIGCNPKRGICVFEGISDGTSGSDLAETGFSDDHIIQTAQLLAQLHSLQITNPGAHLSEPFHLPSSPLLRALPLKMYDQLTAGEIQAWTLLHRDAEVIVALPLSPW